MGYDAAGLRLRLVDAAYSLMKDLGHGFAAWAAELPESKINLVFTNVCRPQEESGSLTAY